MLDLQHLDPTPDLLDEIVLTRASDLSILIVQEDGANGGLYATVDHAGHGGQIAQGPVASEGEALQMHREVDAELND